LRQRIALAAILAAFALLAALRLNRFCLLEPDSSGYLFEAKSLASFAGYREIDHPGSPPHTFRPPGLSLLLVPLAWVAPYSVVGAKIVVLAVALAALVLAWRLAERDGTGAGALVALALVASSPYALLHATEVVTEFPYIAISLAAILVMTRSNEPPSRRDVVLASILLTALPFFRTIGIALVGAAAIWSLADRRRRAWLPAPAIAALGTLLWSLRNHFAGGPTYIGAIAAELKHSGVSGLAAKSLDATGFYASRFLDVLLPGFWPGRPLYERMTVGGTPDLGALYGGAWALGLGAVGLALYGLWTRRHRDGSLIALYVLFFALVLVVYPPRHERLAWPLVPLLWALAPAGVAALRRRPAAIACALAAGGIVVWQAGASFAMARDNLACLSTPDRFYAGRVPPLYFADWQAAGAWLFEHAPKGARVLTRHSDVGLTSGLAQDAVRFEELPPPVWRARIARLPARYLVVPTSLFGKFFPMELLRSDPVYTYEVVWQGADAAVIAVAPNRTGAVVPPEPPSQDLLSACDAAEAREPDRVDLQSRCAELLAASGKQDEAIARLRAIVDRGRADVRIQIALGQLLLDTRQDAEALAAFRAAAGMPEAELLEQTLARGLARAQELAAAKSIDKIVRARTATARARDRMDALRWGEAQALVNEALAFGPYDVPSVVAAADLAMVRQDFEGAYALYSQAGRAGDAAAGAKGEALRAASITEAGFDTAAPDAIVAAARFWGQVGTPGRALTLLERGAARHPGDAAIAQHLAEIRRFYGLD